MARLFLAFLLIGAMALGCADHRLLLTAALPPSVVAEAVPVSVEPSTDTAQIDLVAETPTTVAPILLDITTEVEEPSLALHVAPAEPEDVTPAVAEEVEPEPVASTTKRFAEPELIPHASFRLPVPFRTQKDGSRFQGSNCGPAALAMVFEAYGLVYANDELRWWSHTYQGTAGRRGGTALQHMASVAEDFGFEAVGLYAGDHFHRWTVDEVRQQVQLGRMVIPLVKYRMLPGHEGSTVRYDHYIVIHGVHGDRFLYHDPAYEHAPEGASRWISTAQLDAAIAPTLEPRQAVALGPGEHNPLPAIPFRAGVR